MGKAKYKIVIKDVFPDDYKSDEVQRHNVKKLLFYASTNPDKLQLMGHYLVAKLGRRMKKDFEGHIALTMLVFEELIVACPQHLPLFGDSVVAAIKMLLTSRPQSSHLAVRTWKRYVECEQDLTLLDWEFFVGHFSKMIAPKQPAEKLRDGLEGLAAYILETENFDGLVTKYIATATDTQDERMHNILWKVLLSSDDVSDGMRSVLTNLALRLNATTLRTCLSIMAKVFSTQELWPRADFVSETLTLIAGGKSGMHLRETVIFLAEHSESEPDEVQKYVIGAISGLAQGKNVPSPILDAILPLVRQKDDHSNLIILLLANCSDAERIEAFELILKHDDSKTSRKLISAISEHYSLEEQYEEFARKFEVVNRLLASRKDASTTDLDLFPLDPAPESDPKSSDAPVLAVAAEK